MACSIKNETALVTGATSGIGKSIAFALAAKGVDLCLLGRNQRRLEQTEQELRRIHNNVRSYRCDLSRVDNIHEVTDAIKNDNNNVGILIHAAGVFFRESIENTSIDELDIQYAVNVRAPFLITKLMLPSVKKKKGQVVFLNSSVAQKKSAAKLSAYSASKYALLAVADSLREEVNCHEVRVLSIYPGRTATAMQKKIYELDKKPYQGGSLLQPEDIAQSVIDALEIPRTAEITDISIRPFKKN